MNKKITVGRKAQRKLRVTETGRTKRDSAMKRTTAEHQYATGVLVKRNLLQKWSEPVNQAPAQSANSSVLTRVFNNAASKPLNEDDYFAA